jgi:hypothetical protein
MGKYSFEDGMECKYNSNLVITENTSSRHNISMINGIQLNS